MVLAGVAYENRRKPHIAALIDKLFHEQIMSKNEILARLTAHAASDPAEVTGETGKPDWEKARKLGKTHLVKKVKVKEVKKVVGGFVETTIYTEIELHDPQRAMDMLGKYHELFTSKIKIEDWRSEAIAGIRDGSLTFEAMLGAGFERNLAVELFREAGVSVEVSEGAPTQQAE